MTSAVTPINPEIRDASNGVPTDLIDENPRNPRKSFDAKAHEDLVASVKEKGVLVPVMVRPKGERFELIYGHRRFRAARDAGLDMIPATIRDMDDRQALEAATIENCSRLDIHPLEEGAAFTELHEVHDLTAEEIAAKVGKSRAHIYARMKLSSGLSGKARKAVLEGKLSASVGLLIARIPGEKLQAEALKMLEDDRHRGEDEISYRRAAELIGDNFMLRLAEADFDPKSTTLVAKAGACTVCPKRTGAQPELFADVGSLDVCTDRVCFKGKSDAAWEERKEAAKAEGKKVLPDRDAKKIFPYGDSVSMQAGYVALDAQDYSASKTYRQLAKGEEVEITLARAPSGAVVELIDKTAAARLVRKARPERKAGSSTSPKTSAAEKAKAETAARKDKIEDMVRGAVVTAVADAVAKKAPVAELWDVFKNTVFDNAYESAEEAAIRRGLVTQEQMGKSPSAASNAIEKLYDQLPATGRAALLVELELLGNPYSEALPALVKAYGIDRKKVEADVKAKLKAEEKAASEAKKAQAKKPDPKPSKKKAS